MVALEPQRRPDQRLGRCVREHDDERTIVEHRHPRQQRRGAHARRRQPGLAAGPQRLGDPRARLLAERPGLRERADRGQSRDRLPLEARTRSHGFTAGCRRHRSVLRSRDGRAEHHRRHLGHGRHDLRRLQPRPRLRPVLSARSVREHRRERRYRRISRNRRRRDRRMLRRPQRTGRAVPRHSDRAQLRRSRRTGQRLLDGSARPISTSVSSSEVRRAGATIASNGMARRSGTTRRAASARA